MPQEFLKNLLGHVKSNGMGYLILLAVFASGVISGWIMPSKISAEDQSEMTQYLSGLLQELPRAEIDNRLEMKNAFLSNGALLLLIWFLGLTVIGSPLVLAALFYKGMALGLAIGFLLRLDNPQGLVMVLLAVLPQNFLLVPLFIAASMLAAVFSLKLLRKEYSGVFGRQFLRYSLFFLVLLLGAGLSSCVQGYTVPWLLKSFFKIL
ncbi:MAG: stage II sporulation protein M [Clostridiales bacterium]|nr:stage II sporulation protein M [Clostridiales bacterium]